MVREKEKALKPTTGIAPATSEEAGKKSEDEANGIFLKLFEDETPPYQ